VIPTIEYLFQNYVKPVWKALCRQSVYLEKAHEKLAEYNVDLMTNVRKNMKAKAMLVFGRAMLSKR